MARLPGHATSRTLIATLSSSFAPFLGLLLQASIDEGGLNIPWSLALLVLSVIGYAIVNTVEIAIIGSSRIRMRHLAEEGNRNAQALERIRDREDRFFAAIVLLQNLFMFVASSLAGLLAVDLADITLLPTAADHPNNVFELEVSKFALHAEIGDNRLIGTVGDRPLNHLRVQRLLPTVNICRVALGAFLGAHILALINRPPGGLFLLRRLVTYGQTAKGVCAMTRPLRRVGLVPA